MTELFKDNQDSAKEPQKDQAAADAAPNLSPEDLEKIRADLERFTSNPNLSASQIASLIEYVYTLRFYFDMRTRYIEQYSRVIKAATTEERDAESSIYENLGTQWRNALCIASNIKCGVGD